MAIPRLLNNHTPLTMVTTGSELSFLGRDDSSRGSEEERDSLAQAIAPHLSRLMQRGTAKHVIPAGQEVPEEDPCVSVVAQAQREDFQEFSPTSTRWRTVSRKHRQTSFLSDAEDEDVAAAHCHLQRKQRRKARRQEGGGQPPTIRGLWVQEVEATSSSELVPPPPQFTDSASTCSRDLYEDCSCTDVCECVTGSEDTNDTSSADSDGEHERHSDSSCGAEVGNLTFDLMHVSGFKSSHPEDDSDSAGCLLEISDSSYTSDVVKTSQHAFGLDDMSDTDTVLDILRGRVTQMSKPCVSLFFRDLIKQTLSEWTTSKSHNEGFIFHHQLQPSSHQYREGEEYSVLHHIQNGSYGDVFCVWDRRTGFTCAAKRIPLSRFSSEEASTWSALSSPRVVELFGAVREGLNVVLFMDLKPACLAQILKDMGSLPEDLALHYLHQTLGALEHLHHRKVLHLDIKVDNVLLSADCRDTFLCDFGLSEALDDNGWSTKAFRGATFPGTETHMAPEVARGDRLCAKADMWSSCCMLLHMLNGCHPWIRYYSQPLCLQIVKEPPPLWEVPPNCNNFTAKVFKAGLRKDPERRASAKELRRKTTKALRAVGGLSLGSIRTACEKLHRGKSQAGDTPCSLSPGIGPMDPAVSASAMSWVSPWRTAAMEEDSSEGQDSEVDTREWESPPKSLQDDYTQDEKDWDGWTDSDVDIYMGEEEYIQEKCLKTDGDYEGDWEEDGDEEEEWDSVSTEYLRTLQGLFPLLQKGQQANSWGSEPELEYLRDNVAIGTTIQTPSPEPRDDPPSCFSSSDVSQVDVPEDSDHSSDDLSSGVFSSSNSHTDGHLEWLASANQPSSFCSEGVDIWIENVQGKCLRIRERRQVKVGHVAIGISDQVSGKAFTLETLDRKTVSFEQEVSESCLWLSCVPAPDVCRRWRWRVRDGKLEPRE